MYGWAWSIVSPSTKILDGFEWFDGMTPFKLFFGLEMNHPEF